MDRPYNFYSIDRQKLNDLVRAEAEFWADPNLTYVYGEEDPPEGEPGPFMCHESVRERRYDFAFAVINTLGIKGSTFDKAPDEVQECLDWPEQSVGVQSPEEVTAEVIAALMAWAVTLPEIEWIW